MFTSDSKRFFKSIQYQHACQASTQQPKKGSEWHLLPPAAPVKRGQVIGDFSKLGRGQLPRVSSPELWCRLRVFHKGKGKREFV